jgi:hypothetical protein
VEPDSSAPAHFSVNGAAQDKAFIKAPADSLDSQGRPVSGYEVWLSHGWLMVSNDVNGVFQPARPQSFVHFLDDHGDPAVMSVIRAKQPDGSSRDEPLVVHARSGQAVSATDSDTWTFQGPGGVVSSATIVSGNPVLPQISLLPTVTGDAFYPGHQLTFQSNVSTPGLNAGGRYSWVVDRLGNQGQVLDSTVHDVSENMSGFQDRFDQPGSYRATVHYAGTQSGQPFDASGTVGFTIAQPQPKFVTASLDDDLALKNGLSLNLQMQEPVDHDTFNVDVQWADDGVGHVITRHYDVQCHPEGENTCDTEPLLGPVETPTNGNWSAPSTYTIPDDQLFLPQVTATITNGFGQTTTEVLQAPGEHRPRYADRKPTVQMVAGSSSRVQVTEVTPTALAGDPAITIFPFAIEIEKRLPPGVHADVEQDNGHWYITLFGAPRADDIGPHTFFFPVEQEPVGIGLRPPPALVTLDVVASTAPGYRAVLRNTPADDVGRTYRSAYPEYVVQVAQTLGAGQSFAPFTGTVICRLSASGRTLMQQPCAQDKPFPWPAALDDDAYTAEVWVESSTQPVVADHYSESFKAVFLTQDLSVVPAAANALQQTVRLAVNDHKYSFNGPIATPFSATGYTVTCAVDGAAIAPCLDSGSVSVPRSPGSHQLQTRVVAPDGAVSTGSVSWVVATPATTLTVRKPTGFQHTGGTVRLVVGGLLPREHWRVLIAGHQVATGVASVGGTVDQLVTIPLDSPRGTRKLAVYGATPSRLGTTTLRILGPVRGPVVSPWWPHRAG